MTKNLESGITGLPEEVISRIKEISKEIADWINTHKTKEVTPEGEVELASMQRHLESQLAFVSFLDEIGTAMSLVQWDSNACKAILSASLTSTLKNAKEYAKSVEDRRIVLQGVDIEAFRAKRAVMEEKLKTLITSTMQKADSQASAPNTQPANTSNHTIH